MVMIKFGDKEFSMCGYLYKNLEVLREAVRKDWDGVGYICGLEGDGKSTMAAQICAFLDPNFSLSQVVFNAEQFEKAIEEAKPETAIMYDEAYDVFESKAAWTQTSRRIKSLLTRIRKKRLFIIVVSPVFFEISTYLTIHRSRFMIHVYSDGLERGYYRFFNRENKYKLYQYGYKYKNMHGYKCNFFGRFTSFFPLIKEAYENKKDEGAKISEKPVGKAIDPVSIAKEVSFDAQCRLLEWLRTNQWLKIGAIQAVARGFMRKNKKTVSNKMSLIRWEAENTEPEDQARGKESIIT